MQLPEPDLPAIPLVSILIPCYNGAICLAETLESALAQTYQNTEILLVDDGSTDSSLSIARSFEPRGVRVFTQLNSGAAAARNRALRLAQGDYIQFLDADDLLAPDKIALQLAALRAAPPLAIASGTWGRFTADPASTVWSTEAVYAARSGIAYLQIHYETGSMMQPGAWLAPRALLNLAGPWDETLSLNDDGEYFARVTLRASSIVPVPAARCHYRTGSAASLSRRCDTRALTSLHRSVELTSAHLLSADRSPRSHAAAALAWRASAFELYPDAPNLARAARRAARSLDHTDTPRGGPAWVAHLARLTGWTFARRLHLLRNRLL